MTAIIPFSGLIAFVLGFIAIFVSWGKGMAWAIFGALLINGWLAGDLGGWVREHGMETMPKASTVIMRISQDIVVLLSLIAIFAK